jgi:hypothetical protein
LSSLKYNITPFPNSSPEDGALGSSDSN